MAIRVCCLFVVLISVFTHRIAAQTIQGEILGNVHDETGGVVPGVEVSAVSLETGFSRSTVTNELGFFSLPHLEPGRYRVSAELVGFKRFVREPVHLESNKRVRIDVMLAVGEVSDQVLVETPTPTVETETGRIADVVDGRSLRHVVMGGRGVFNWVNLTVGAYFGSGGYSLNGSRASANGSSIDGVNTGDPVTGTEYQPMRPDQEMLREVRVDSVNNSAEFAHAGTISQTTMSGSNEFHGQATWNHINGALNARSFFSPRRPRGIPVNNVFLSAGGPVIVPGLYDGRDKTFFFAHVDGQERNEALPRVFSVPTQAMRRGDFSAIGAVRDPITGQPFSNNLIPSNRLNPTAVKYMDRFYPVPTLNLATPASNFARDAIFGRSDRAWAVRLDQKLSEKNTMFVRYWMSTFEFKSPDGGGMPLELIGRQFRLRKTRSAIFADTHTFSPTVINEFRLGYIRHTQPLHGPLRGREIADLVGLTGFPSPLPADEFGLPSVSVSGLLGISQTATTRDTQNSWNIVNSLTFIRGNHHFKSGVDIQHSGDSRLPASPSAQFGSFSFDGFATGQPFGDFLLGIPRTASRSGDVGPYYGSSNEWAVFFLDDWKVSPRFTLNWGVRYELHYPWVEQSDRLHSFDPKSGSLVVPTQAVIAKIHPLFPKEIPIRTAGQAGLPERSLVETDTNDVAPRLGFAWRSGLSDLIVRGGYGLFYNFESRKGFRPMTGGPFVATETFDNRITNGQPLWSWPLAFPSASARPLGTQNIVAMAVDRNSSYVHQWNLTLEKQIRDYGVRLSYVGSSAIQLPYRRNLNQPRAGSTPFAQANRPFPIYRDITFFDRGATQSYNAFQAQVIRRFARGFSLNAHYTWAKNLTDSLDNSIFGDLVDDAWDRRSERGNESYGLRHRFLAHFIWELPVGRGRSWLSSAHPLAEGILGGWTVSGHMVAYSGQWLTPFFTGRDISNTNVTSGRPDRICDGNKSGDQRHFNSWFDAACFVRPAAGIGRFGNSGQGVIEGPGNWGINLGVFKYFHPTEHINLRLQGHFMNVLNHVMVADPAMNINAANVGIISGTRFHVLSDIWSNRQIEVGLRLEF